MALARSALWAGAGLGREPLLSVVDWRSEQRSRRRTLWRAPISPGAPWKWPAMTRASWWRPPSRWPISARTSARWSRWSTAHWRSTRISRGWHVSGILREMGGLARPRNRAPRSRAAPQSRVRVGSSLAFIGIAHFLCRRFDEAVPKLLLAIQEDPSYSQPYRYLAALLLVKPL